MTDIWEAGYAGPIGNLTAAHLGEDIRISYLKKYRYNSEDRVKVVVYYGPTHIYHRYDNGEFRTQLRVHDKPGSRYYGWIDFSPTDNIVVEQKVRKT